MGHMAGDFCTPVHRFAQTFDRNLIDAAKRKDYFAFQIEPGSLKNFTDQFRGRNKRNSGCAARLNREARSLYVSVWRMRQA